MHATMCWSCAGDAGGTPTIKNHTATLVGNSIFVFGGYDGRRNHNSIHILDCGELRDDNKFHAQPKSQHRSLLLLAFFPPTERSESRWR